MRIIVDCTCLFLGASRWGLRRYVVESSRFTYNLLFCTLLGFFVVYKRGVLYLRVTSSASLNNHLPSEVLCYLVGSMGESHVEVFATAVKIEGVIKLFLEPIINFEGNEL